MRSIVTSLLFSLVVVLFMLSRQTEAKQAKTFLGPCDICQLVVSVIAQTEKSYNATLQEIIAVVDSLCVLIGGGIVGAECKFITDSITEIIDWIEQNFTPADICYKLKLCNSTITDSAFTPGELRRKTSPIISAILPQVRAQLGNQP